MKKIISSSLHLNTKEQVEQFILLDKRQGGSPAWVYILQDPVTHTKRVRKLSNSPLPNGKAHLKSEYKSRLALKRAYPDLSKCFATIYNDGEMYGKMQPLSNVNNSANIYYFDQEYVGPNLMDWVQNKQLSINQFKQHYSKLNQQLWEHGYSRFTQQLSESARQSRWTQFYQDRLLTRLNQLSSKLFNISPDLGNRFDTLRTQPTLMVSLNQSNPIRIHNLLWYAPHILADKRWQHRLAPHLKTAITHQDTNPENICWNGPNSVFKLIDCHGGHDTPPSQDPNNWDGCQEPAFDFGKCMFGLDGFSDILHERYSLTYQKGSGIWHYERPQSYTHFRNAVIECLHDPALASLRDQENNLIDRVKFICSLQYLMDLVYRDDLKTITAQVIQASLTFQEFFSNEYKDLPTQFITKSNI